MKIININKPHFFAILFLIATSSVAQVSIGYGNPTTSSPEGLVDMKNSTAGIVYPRFALTSTLVEAPVLNPNGGGLVAGTVVYNTNTTTTGTNDVYPGIYAWNGSKWTTQYIKEDSEISSQSSLGQRIAFVDPWEDITGLGDGSSFTPKYTGTYRVKAYVNFGAGEIENNASYVTSMATQEGDFRITLGTTEYEIYTHAYSVHNDDIASPDDYFEQFRHDSTLIVYVDLTAGVSFPYRFEIDVFLSTDFVNGGNTGTGRAYVGVGLPCSIEFTYLVE